MSPYCRGAILILMEVAPLTPTPKNLPLASKLTDSSISVTLCPSLMTILANSAIIDWICFFAFSMPFAIAEGSTATVRTNKPPELSRYPSSFVFGGDGSPLVQALAVLTPNRAEPARPFLVLVPRALSRCTVERPDAGIVLAFFVMEQLSCTRKRKSMDNEKKARSCE